MRKARSIKQNKRHSKERKFKRHEADTIEILLKITEGDKIEFLLQAADVCRNKAQTNIDQSLMLSQHSNKTTSV